MADLSELERTLKQLPVEDKWHVAEWLLQDLHESSFKTATQSSARPLPDFERRRRKIFGDETLPNLVLDARSDERW